MDELPTPLDLWPSSLWQSSPLQALSSPELASPALSPWQPTAAQQTQFQALYQGIVRGNALLNLTRLTEPAEFWEKHLWDSLRGVSWLLSQEQTQPGATQNLSVLDIGTGGGFPGIPVAIALPQTSVTLLDSTRKKVAFLEALALDLGLTNISTQTARAEALGQDPDHRETYDLTLIRAVGPATVCAEYCLPLLDLGGTAVLYRGQWTAEEESALSLAVEQLGGEIHEIQAFTTPLSAGARHCIYLKKYRETPKRFPRPVGIPQQRPLGLGA